MAPDIDDDSILEKIVELLTDRDNGDRMRALMEQILNITMKLEREKALGAGSYERNTQREGYANGYKPKQLRTRLGTLNLQVPQTRGIEFYPQSIEKGSRSEVALKLSMAQMYISGVSTRRVAEVTKKLCGEEFTSAQVSRAAQELDVEFEKFRNRPLGQYTYVYLDATYLKVRHEGVVVDMAILIATGVNTEGRRELLGLSASLSEAEVHWRSFLESLSSRGLHGVKLITSDAHSGLQEARMKVFPAIPWQRCQFHLCQNAVKHIPKKDLVQPLLNQMQEVFACTSMDDAEQKIQRTIDKYKGIAPHFVSWFDANIREGLTCLKFHTTHRKKIRTTNPLERLNREIKRRTRVAVLFPNPESALRLVTGVVIEIHEEWVTGRKFLEMDIKEEKNVH